MRRFYIENLKSESPTVISTPIQFLQERFPGSVFSAVDQKWAELGRYGAPQRTRAEINRLPGEKSFFASFTLAQADFESERAKLQAAEERIARAVCGGGALAPGESDECERLRISCGYRFDAINREWLPYSAPESNNTRVY